MQSAIMKKANWKNPSFKYTIVTSKPSPSPLSSPSVPTTTAATTAATTTTITALRKSKIPKTRLFILFYMILNVTQNFCYLNPVMAEDILLKCDDNDMESLFCTVSDFQVSHSQNVKIPTQMKANQKRFMKFYNSVLLYIPAKLFDVYNSLTNFDASDTEIVDIPRNTFSAASTLVTLTLSNNKLERITTSAFVGAHSLMRLDLSFNRLHTLTNLTFSGLPELSRVVLSNNLLKILPKDLFAENAYLDEVNLANNQLEYIEPDVFNHLDSIREVNLTNNRLTSIAPDTFSNSYALEVLALAGNQLTEFHLANKSITKLLNLSNNRLNTLQVNGTHYVYANYNNISDLDIINGHEVNVLMLRGNKIHNMINITKLTRLNELDLSYNPVGTPNISTYQRLDRLTDLYLRATSIQYLKFGMFSKLISLKTLDLAYNNLTYLNLEIFVPSNEHITYFYLDANNLTEIQGKYSFASAFPFLVELGISRNRFNCTYLHWLLITPQLYDKTRLHIEPDDSIEEVTHIRDVTCVSHMHDDLNKIEHELHNSKELRNILQQSLKTLSQHAEHMESYLLVLKITLLVLVCIVCILLAWQYGRHYCDAKYNIRNGATIVYHSNATVHTHVEQ